MGHVEEGITIDVQGEAMKKDPHRYSKLLGGALGTAGFALLAWWLHPHWASYGLGLLAVANGYVLLFRGMPRLPDER